MNNHEFVEKLKKTLDYKTVYMWGTFGTLVTENFILQKSKQYPSWYNLNKQQELRRLVSRNYYAFDCAGLVKGIFWGWVGDNSKPHGGAKYNPNNDVSSNMMINLCDNISSNFENIELGEILWLKGHVGVYIGNNEVIEATPAWQNGVQITKLSQRKWLKHGKLPWLEYKKESFNEIEILRAENKVLKEKIEKIKKILEV